MRGAMGVYGGRFRARLRLNTPKKANYVRYSSGVESDEGFLLRKNKTGGSNPEHPLSSPPRKSLLLRHPDSDGHSMRCLFGLLFDHFLTHRNRFISQRATARTVTLFRLPGGIAKCLLAWRLDDFLVCDHEAFLLEMTDGFSSVRWAT